MSRIKSSAKICSNGKRHCRCRHAGFRLQVVQNEVEFEIDEDIPPFLTNSPKPHEIDSKGELRNLCNDDADSENLRVLRNAVGGYTLLEEKNIPGYTIGKNENVLQETKGSKKMDVHEQIDKVISLMELGHTGRANINISKSDWITALREYDDNCKKYTTITLPSSKKRVHALLVNKHDNAFSLIIEEKLKTLMDSISGKATRSEKEMEALFCSTAISIDRDQYNKLIREVMARNVLPSSTKKETKPLSTVSNIQEPTPILEESPSVNEEVEVVEKPEPLKCNVCQSDVHPTKEIYYRTDCLESCSIFMHKECLRNIMKNQGFKQKREYKDAVCPTEGCGSQLQAIFEYGMDNKDILHLRCAEKQEKKKLSPPLNTKKDKKKENQNKRDFKKKSCPEVEQAHEESTDISESIAEEVKQTVDPKNVAKPHVTLSANVSAVPLQRKEDELFEKYGVTEQHSAKNKHQKHQKAKKNVLDIEFQSNKIRELESGDMGSTVSSSARFDDDVPDNWDTDEIESIPPYFEENFNHLADFPPAHSEHIMEPSAFPPPGATEESMDNENILSSLNPILEDIVLNTPSYSHGANLPASELRDAIILVANHVLSERQQGIINRIFESGDVHKIKSFVNNLKYFTVSALGNVPTYCKNRDGQALEQKNVGVKKQPLPPIGPPKPSRSVSPESLRIAFSEKRPGIIRIPGESIVVDDIHIPNGATSVTCNPSISEFFPTTAEEGLKSNNIFGSFGNSESATNSNSELNVDDNFTEMNKTLFNNGNHHQSEPGRSVEDMEKMEDIKQKRSELQAQIARERFEQQDGGHEPEVYHFEDYSDYHWADGDVSSHTAPGCSVEDMEKMEDIKKKRSELQAQIERERWEQQDSVQEAEGYHFEDYSESNYHWAGGDISSHNANPQNFSMRNNAPRSEKTVSLDVYKEAVADAAIEKHKMQSENNDLRKQLEALQARLKASEQAKGAIKEQEQAQIALQAQHLKEMETRFQQTEVRLTNEQNLRFKYQQQMMLKEISTHLKTVSSSIAHISMIVERLTSFGHPSLASIITDFVDVSNRWSNVHKDLRLKKMLVEEGRLADAESFTISEPPALPSSVAEFLNSGQAYSVHPFQNSIDFYLPTVKSNLQKIVQAAGKTMPNDDKIVGLLVAELQCQTDFDAQQATVKIATYLGLTLSTSTSLTSSTTSSPLRTVPQSKATIGSNAWSVTNKATNRCVDLNEHECAICFERILKDPQTSVLDCPVCKEPYHRPCVRNWLNRNATCPSCRQIWPDPENFPGLV